ncbi:hypothetical protein F3Y22_tig00111402pilonHSYRG00400 [Hibiscus syriacus]|uniref:Response regulatory domain-containing protein n=1 Tax=Hibiscus syriacus TaxID=106335 RepID=A0A6A2YJ45_HIBSY|nr:hypothetical protein F3Y22_tig00111402pilonHSYRG00400 [Hibiscus syriacus]
MEDNFLNKPIGSHIDDDLTVENLRVLACDADINSLTYLCAVLVNCKYKVKHATSAAEAVGILNANKEGFDVVFVDVDTHSSDAFKLMETIRHEMRLPLIMVTGDVSPENKTKGLSHGAVDCIRKRPEKEEIMNTIRHHFTQDGPSEKDGKKKRMVWTPGLDAKFVKSVQTLEKKNMAHPMRILAMMNEQGLTRKHVASHLQKYRISLNKAKAAKMKEQGSPLEATSCRRRLEFENFNADLGLPVNEVHSLNSSLGPTMGDTAMPSSGSSSVPFQSHDLHNCLGGQTPDVFDNYLLETNVQPHNLEPEAVSGTTYQSQSPYLQGEGPVTILPSGPEFYVFPYKFLKRERIAAYRLPPAVSPVSYNLNGIANNVHYPVSTVNGVTEPSVGNGTTESPSGTSSRLNSEPNNQMNAILRKDGCLAAISERLVDFTDENKWIEMDGNAMANFHLALADEVLSSIEEKKTAKEIWDHLTKLYEVTSLHNKIFLKRKLYTLRMPESTSVTEHLNTLNTLFSQLTSLSCKIGEQERAELLLQSLPDSYDQLIINLTNSNVTSLVFNDVSAAVLQEENRRKNKEDRQVNLQQAEALTMITMMTTMRGRSIERGQSSSHKHGNTANTSDDGDALCCEVSTTVERRKRFADIWIIDSGATYHMTSRREWFHHYEPVSGGSVYSCNDHALEIIGVGTIKLKMYDGTIKVARDVRHMKGLKKNLLSYGLLDNNASKIETRKGIMKVFRGALVVLKGEKIDANLYMLKGETLLEAEASVALCSSDSAMLCHKKLGHMSEQGMKVLVEQKLLPGLTKISLPLCEHCITSKHHRLKFNTSNSRGKSVLELVHSDIWQALVTSLGLEKSIWAEAVNTACYLVNRAPSTAIELMTPMEMWTGKPADYSNLHIFGSIVYVMYNSQEISKLDPKSRKCKFLGYVDGVKGYRLWDPTARKVIISRDVIFVEDKLQRKEDDDSAEKSETTQIHVEKSLKKEIILKQNQHMMNKNQRVLKLQQLVNQIV